MTLYWALKQGHRIVLLTDDTYDEAMQWLRLHGLHKDLDGVVDTGATLAGEVLRHRQIALTRAHGRVDMVVDPDPHVIAWAFEQGMTGVLFAHPLAAAPQLRPDLPRPLRRWDEIERAITEQKVGPNLDEPDLKWDEA